MALEDSDSYVETSFGHDGTGWIENAVGNLLGLDAQSGDAAWKVDMENNNEQSAINRAFQREMADLQYYRSTPANQMRLYREAGLNPSLMYGQMSDLQTSVPAGSEASHGGAPNGQFASLLGLIPDAARVAGQLSTIPEQKEYLKSLAANQWSQVPLNAKRIAEIDSKIQDLVAGIELKKSTKEYQDALTKNISFDQLMKVAHYYLDVSKFQLDYERFGLEKLKTNEELKKIQAETRALLARAKVSERELAEMIDTYAIRRSGLVKNNELMDAKIREADATADKLRKQGVQIDLQNDVLSPQADRKRTMMNDLQSNNVLENVGGLILYGVDYVTNDILGGVSSVLKLN